MPDSLWRWERLRKQAWDEVRATREYAILHALDLTALAAGGESILLGSTSVPGQNAPMPPDQKLQSKQDAAFQFLSASAFPLQLSEILKLVNTSKLVVGEGNCTIASLRALLARDGRFLSFRVGRTFYWWISGRELPQHR